MNDEEERRIREEAYHLWVAEGRPHGRQDEHWRKAKDALSAKTPPNMASSSDELEAKPKRGSKTVKAKREDATKPIGATRNGTGTKSSKKASSKKASTEKASSKKASVKKIAKAPEASRERSETSGVLPNGKHHGR